MACVKGQVKSQPKPNVFFLTCRSGGVQVVMFLCFEEGYMIFSSWPNPNLTHLLLGSRMSAQTQSRREKWSSLTRTWQEFLGMSNEFKWTGLNLVEIYLVNGPNTYGLIQPIEQIVEPGPISWVTDYIRIWGAPVLTIKSLFLDDYELLYNSC